MHFIGHFYVLDTYSPPIVAGVLLPDLIRPFTPVYNQYIRRREEQTNCPVLTGVDIHYRTDELFHQHVLFNSFVDDAKEDLYNVFGKQINRKHTLAHIGVELLLDHMIALESPNVISEKYNSIDKLTMQHFTCMSKTTGQDISSLFKAIDQYRKRRYVEKITDIQVLLYPIEHIMKRTNFRSFTEEERATFMNLFISWKKIIWGQWKPIIEDIRYKLNT